VSPSRLKAGTTAVSSTVEGTGARRVGCPQPDRDRGSLDAGGAGRWHRAGRAPPRAAQCRQRAAPLAAPGRGVLVFWLFWFSAPLHVPAPLVLHRDLGIAAVHKWVPQRVINCCQLLRPPRKNLLRYRTLTMPIADMRQVVAAIDDRPRHSGGGCTLSKQTPRPAAVASPMGHPDIGHKHHPPQPYTPGGGHAASRNEVRCRTPHRSRWPSGFSPLPREEAASSVWISTFG